MGRRKRLRELRRQSKHWLVWLIYGCAVLAILTPLIPRPNDYFSTVLWKAVPFQVLVEIMLICWVPLMISDRRYRPRFGAVTVALLAWGAAMLLILPFGQDPAMSFWSLTNRMTGVFAYLHLLVWFLVLSSTLRSRGEWQMFLSSSTLVATFVAGTAIVKWINEAAQVHIDTQFGNSSYLTSYVLPHVLIALYLWSQGERGSFRRTAWLVSAAALSFTVVIAASRAGILALICSLSLAGLGLILLSGLSRRKKVAVGLAVGIIATTLVGSFFALKTPQVSAWLADRGTLPSFAQRLAFRDFGGDRLELWGMALKGIAERPMFGWGNEQYIKVAAKHLDVSGRALDVFHESWQTKAHNQYLDTAVSFGLVGLAFYLAFWLAVAVALLRAFRESESARDRRGLMLISVFFACYLGYSFFFFDSPHQMMVIYMLLAMLVVFGLHSSERGTFEPVRISLTATSTAVALAVVLLPVAWFANAVPLMKVSTFAEGVEAMRSDWVEAAEHFGRSHSGWNPYSYEMFLRPLKAVKPYIDYHQTADRSDMDAENLVRAVAAGVAEAVRRHPDRVDSLYQAADAHRILYLYDDGALDRAQEYAQRHMDVAPNRYDGHHMMGELAFLRGDIEDALWWMDSARALTFRKNGKFIGYLDYRCACMHASQGNYHEMMRRLGDVRAFPAAKDSRLVLELADVRSPADELRGVEPYLDSVMTNFQRNPKILAAGAKIYSALGHDDMARQVLDSPAMVGWGNSSEGKQEYDALRIELGIPNAATQPL